MTHLIEVILVSWLLFSVPASLLLCTMMRVRGRALIDPRTPGDSLGGSGLSGGSGPWTGPRPRRVNRLDPAVRPRTSVAVKTGAPAVTPDGA